MVKCRRCGGYAYHPVRIGALCADWEQKRGIVILWDGWENIDTLCRDCAGELDEFLDGERVEEINND